VFFRPWINLILRSSPILPKSSARADFFETQYHSSKKPRNPLKKFSFFLDKFLVQTSNPDWSDVFKKHLQLTKKVFPKQVFFIGAKSMNASLKLRILNMDFLAKNVQMLQL
jgi:hypothetical protein